jgi:hypothetical protein
MFDDWYGFVREEALVSFIEHVGGIIANNELCLEIEVPHHGVAVPPTHHMDVAAVSSAMEQGHGTSFPQGASTNLRGFNAGAMDIDPHGIAQDFCDILGFDESDL